MHSRPTLAALIAALATTLAGSLAAAGEPPCDGAGADAFDVATVRRAVEAGCDCDGFPSHGAYVQCAVDVLRAEHAAGRLRRACISTVRRIARRSTCSFANPKIVCCQERGERSTCKVRTAEACGGGGGGAARTACTAVRFCADARCGIGLLRKNSTCEPSLLYASEGNRLRRFDIDTIKQPPLAEDIFIERASSDPEGRDINGQVCPLPDGSGGFVAGEDTGQPNPPPGWGVFDATGTQIGKLATTYQNSMDNSEPHGCAFAPDGNLFTSDVGNQATGDPNGQLTMWFPPLDRFPGPPGAYPNTNERSTNFCKIAVDIGTAGSVATDELGRVYVSAARGSAVYRFSPPFPTAPDAAGGCGATDPTGAPLATSVARETFIAGATTASGIARARNGNWYVGQVLGGVINEYDANGVLLRQVMAPPPGQTTLPLSTGHPQGLAVDCAGDLYFADIALRISPGGIGPGPNGKVRRIPFDVCGDPLPPEVVKDGLAFPDGLGVLPGDLQ